MAVSRYLADNNDVHAIRLSPARLAVAGAPPAGAVTSEINVKVSKSNREYGIRPRGVVLSRPVAPGPDDKIFRSFLPVLTPTAFASATFAKGANLIVGGTTWIIISKQNEDY